MHCAAGAEPLHTGTRREDLPQRTSAARRRLVRAGMTRDGKSRCAAHLHGRSWESSNPCPRETLGTRDPFRRQLSRRQAGLRSERRRGRGPPAHGVCGRSARRRQVLLLSPPCTTRAALCGRSPVLMRACFAAARTANRSRAHRARRPWRSAQRSAHAALQRKGSHDNGAGCPDRDQLRDVQDDRRPGHSTVWCTGSFAE